MVPANMPFVVVVKKTFRLRNAFLRQPPCWGEAESEDQLCRHPFFRNIIMTSGKRSHKNFFEIGITEVVQEDRYDGRN